jgi:hypothetical protein
MAPLLRGRSSDIPYELLKFIAGLKSIFHVFWIFHERQKSIVYISCKKCQLNKLVNTSLKRNTIQVTNDAVSIIRVFSHLYVGELLSPLQGLLTPI